MAIIHWFPTVIYRIIRILEIPNCIIFRTVANTFHWLGPILNPIMYSFMSAKFRRQLVWTLRCTNITKDRFFTEAMKNSLLTMIYGPYNIPYIICVMFLSSKIVYSFKCQCYEVHEAKELNPHDNNLLLVPHTKVSLST